VHHSDRFCSCVPTELRVRAAHRCRRPEGQPAEVRARASSPSRRSRSRSARRVGHVCAAGRPRRPDQISPCLRKRPVPSRLTTHTEVSLCETSSPTYCFMLALRISRLRELDDNGHLVPQVPAAITSSCPSLGRRHPGAGQQKKSTRSLPFLRVRCRFARHRRILSRRIRRFVAMARLKRRVR
jgi:hypothetical protein